MFEDAPETISVPPTPESVLMEILDGNQFKPSMFPRDNFEAAQFWIDHQEPANKYSERVERSKDGWKTPYHDRLALNLKIFLVQTHINKVYILEHCKRVPWRGDKMDLYKNVVNQHLYDKAEVKAE